jgi:hypothetical protein
MMNVLVVHRRATADNSWSAECQNYDVYQVNAPPDFPDHHHFQHDDDALSLIVHGSYQGHVALPLAVHGQQNYDLE